MDLTVTVAVTVAAAVVAAIIIMMTVRSERTKRAHRARAAEITAEMDRRTDEAVQRRAARPEPVQPGDGDLFGSGPGMPLAPVRRLPRNVPPLRSGPRHPRVGDTPGFDAPAPHPGHWTSGPMSEGHHSGGGHHGHYSSGDSGSSGGDSGGSSGGGD